MTIAYAIVLLVVFAVGFPAAWRMNPTAIALVIAWAAGEVFTRTSGDSMPTNFYPFTDVFVMAMIRAKVTADDCMVHRNVWHKLVCVFMEMPVADRIVMSIFTVLWPLYALPIHDYYKWQALAFLTVMQFLAVGTENITEIIQERKARSTDNPSGGAFYRLAWGRGYG